MSMGSRSLPPPTPDELGRISAARALGCVACLMLGLPLSAHCGRLEQHHLLVAGLRAGHRYSVILGKFHHQGEPQRSAAKYGPDLKFHKGDFKARFGTDQALLNFQDDLLDIPRVDIPSRRQLRLEHGFKRPEREKPVRRKASATAKPDKCRIGWTP